MGDIFFLINQLFSGGPVTTLEEGDASSNGSIGADDVFFLINHIFAGGPTPAP